MNITKISLCFFLSTQNIHNHHTGKLKWKKIVSNEKSVPSSQFTCLWTMVDSFFWGGGSKGSTGFAAHAGAVEEVVRFAGYKG